MTPLSSHTTTIAAVAYHFGESNHATEFLERHGDTLEGAVGLYAWLRRAGEHLEAAVIAATPERREAMDWYTVIDAFVASLHHAGSARVPTDADLMVFAHVAVEHEQAVLRCGHTERRHEGHTCPNR